MMLLAIAVMGLSLQAWGATDAAAAAPAAAAGGAKSPRADRGRRFAGLLPADRRERARPPCQRDAPVAAVHPAAA